MDNVLTREQEIRNELEQIQKDKVRLKVPKLYQYLQDNNYVFEKVTEAFKPINEKFEIGVTIHNFETYISFYDRSHTKVSISSNTIYRYKIYSQQKFVNERQDEIIQYLENLPTPKKYQLNLNYQTEFYFLGELEEAKSEAISKIEYLKCKDLNLTVKEINE